MRVLVLCLSPDRGGLEQHVVAQLRALAARDDVELLTALRAGSWIADQVRELARPGLTYADVPGRTLPLLAAWRLGRWLRAQRVDLVLTHWRRDVPLAALARRLRGPRTKLVHTQHLMLGSPKRDPYHALLYGACDGYIAVSEALAAQAREFLPLHAGAVACVHPGVPPRSTAARAGGGPFTVGVVGRILPAKGQHVALRAAARLAGSGVPVRVVLAGHAEEPAYLAQLQAAAGVALDVRGFVAPDAAYAGLDVLAMCSEAETFGLVTVEAMRRGIAVVATASGGTPEIVRDGVDGLLFAPGDDAALAHHLQRLAADPALRARLAASAHARAAAAFDAATQHARAFAESVRLAGLRSG